MLEFGSLESSFFASTANLELQKFQVFGTFKYTQKAIKFFEHFYNRSNKNASIRTKNGFLYSQMVSFAFFSSPQ